MAAFIFTWSQILLRSLFWLVIGVGLLVIYPFDPASAGGETFVASRELLFATGIRDLLPAGIKGIMLTGVLAALGLDHRYTLDMGSQLLEQRLIPADCESSMA